jgi:hypothetical protein
MISNLPSNVQKYLMKYADENRKFEINEDTKFDLAVVIPAISEYENLIRLLNSLAENNFNESFKIVLIIVINSCKSSSREVKEENKKTLQLLHSILNKDLEHHPTIKKFVSSGLNLGIVDASSKGCELPDKTGGVGLARKIGMDLALTIFDYSKPAKRIIASLDADCLVKENYIEVILSAFIYKNFNAAVINYEHPLPEDDETRKAIICYEIFLRYYQLGLKYAASSYDFQTVGSTMVCDHEAYIKVEGMNRRKAAEEFYFLEKLAKHYTVGRITSTKVFPSPRPSWRVPFGTGQRVTRFLSKSQNEYLLYHPESFIILKGWLKLFHSNKSLSSKDYLQKAKEIHIELSNFLKEQNFERNWDKILLNAKDEKHMQSQKVKWFDGFRTLKLIHHFRDKAFPLMNMFDALDIIFEYCNLSPVRNRKGKEVPGESIQKEYLDILRATLNNDN